MWLQQHRAFWNLGSNIEGNWITRVYEDNLKIMLSTQNASLGTTNYDIRRSFPWKHSWKSRRQQCNNVVSFNHWANHQNHEWTNKGVSKLVYVWALLGGCQVFTNSRRGPNWTYPLPPMHDVLVLKKTTYYQCSHGYRILKRYNYVS